MEYAGENLLPGQLGHFFGILSLLASLLATLAYFKSTQASVIDKQRRWLRIARLAFFAEAFAVVALLCLLFFILNNHLFEYKYAWQHSSVSLERKYLFAALWEGQEGSFLLWSFWHCVIGLLLIRFSKQWEASVMTVLSVAQVCLAALISGIHIFGLQLGSDPFALLREVMNDPVFSQADYLSFIKDGNDLNPLLQNYWMVIHPPVLFLGFAACIVPFAYAMAALWTQKFTEWVSAVLPWTLLAAATLGTGIAMGALWAYESLSFGGYWAWDPVENASLVPWLLLVAAIHTLIICKSTGFSLRISFVLILTSFLLVLYSTYLTRSGILGDTSVHAFGAGGTGSLILVFIALFALPSFILYAYRRKSIPAPQKEENLLSREWWMFTGAVLLTISAGSIIYMTSLPVFNQLAHLFSGNDRSLFKPMAPGADSLYSYNRIQIVVAAGAGLLAGFTQFLNYKATSWRNALKKASIPFALSIIIGVSFLLTGKMQFTDKGNWFQLCIWVAFIMALYTVIANIFYFFRRSKLSSKLLGSVLAHCGFGLMIAGILLSSVGKEVVSMNHTGMPSGLTEFDMEKPGENLTLFKNVRTAMGDYWVTYRSDSSHPEKPLWYYSVRFYSKDKQDSFDLAPTAFVNYRDKAGLMSNPAYKRYWDHDLFVYITSLSDPAVVTDSTIFTTKVLETGDSLEYNGYNFQLQRIQTKTNVSLAGLTATDSVSVATVSVTDRQNQTYVGDPLAVRRNGSTLYMDDTLHKSNLILRLLKASSSGAVLGIAEITEPVAFLTLKVYRFPLISFMWIGIAVLIIGFLISMIQRIRNKGNGMRKV